MNARQNFPGVSVQGWDGRVAYIQLRDDQTISVEMFRDEDHHLPETMETFVSVGRLLDVAEELENEDARKKSSAPRSDKDSDS